MSTERRHTFTLKDNWPGPSVSVGADVRFYLRIVVSLLLIWRGAVTIVLASIGRYDLTMYTYWSHTILVAFYVLLALALWIERGLLTFVALFAFVFPLGSTFLVAVSIIIIIQENSAVFFAADAGSEQLALSLIHTGDWILHSLPLIEILLIMGLGWLLYARAIIASEVSAIRKSEWKAAYVLYWILAPVVPLLVYSLVFDVAKHYPTGIPTYVLWLGLVALDLIWMGLWFFAFTSSANIGVVVYSFFSSRRKPEEEDTPGAEDDSPGSPARMEAAQAASLYMQPSYATSKRFGAPQRDAVVRYGASDENRAMSSVSPSPPPPPTIAQDQPMYYNPRFRASTTNPEGFRTLLL